MFTCIVFNHFLCQKVNFITRTVEKLNDVRYSVKPEDLTREIETRKLNNYYIYIS